MTDFSELMKHAKQLKDRMEAILRSRSGAAEPALEPALRG